MAYRETNTVFKFTIWYEFDEPISQTRYVVATTEEEAEEKLERENERLVNEGCMRFHIGRSEVDISEVII